MLKHGKKPALLFTWGGRRAEEESDNEQREEGERRMCPG